MWGVWALGMPYIQVPGFSILIPTKPCRTVLSLQSRACGHGLSQAAGEKEPVSNANFSASKRILRERFINQEQFRWASISRHVISIMKSLTTIKTTFPAKWTGKWTWLSISWGRLLLQSRAKKPETVTSFSLGQRQHKKHGFLGCAFRLISFQHFIPQGFKT